MKASRLMPLFGILAVALLVVSFAVSGEPPDVDDPINKVVAFYNEHDSDNILAAILMMFSASAFLVWAVQVRRVLFEGEGGSATRTTLGLVGAVIFATGIAIFAGISFSLGEAPEKLAPETIQTLHVLNVEMFAPLAVGMVLLLWGNGLAILKTGAFPKWLGWMCCVGGIFSVTPLWFVPFIATGLLIILSSVMLAMRGDGAPAAAA